MNVVQSIYTFDEKVLIYVEYDKLLHEILDKVKRYYGIKERNKWSCFAFISGTSALVSVVLTILFFKQSNILSVILTILGCLFSVLIFVYCWSRFSLLKQESKQLISFLEREKKEISTRDNEVRSLRLLDRIGFNKVQSVERCENGFCLLFFDSSIYNKPCIIDSLYFTDKDKLNLGIYDDYYTEIKKRIDLLKKANTLYK